MRAAAMPAPPHSAIFGMQPSPTATLALIVSDGKPGHENQSVALCRHLGLEYRIARVGYVGAGGGRPAKGLSYLFDRFGRYSDRLFRFADGTPAMRDFALVISAGSTAFYPAKVLARRAGRPQIAILYPRGYRTDVRWILAPAYDRLPKRPNIIELPVNLSPTDAGFLAAQAEAFAQRHPQRAPAVGFIIGGPNAVSDIDPAALREQLEQAFRLTEGYERWVTTSRRTPEAVERLVESLPFDYRLIYSRDPFNPIPAFLQLCERLFVTSDSTSMISECASVGRASVEILLTRQRRPDNKFLRLIDRLAEAGAVHRFDGTLGNASRKIDLAPLLRPLLADPALAIPPRAGQGGEGS